MSEECNCGAILAINKTYWQGWFLLEALRLLWLHDCPRFWWLPPILKILVTLD